MAGTNDWYRNREFAADRDPRYDPSNDDPPDQLALGELSSERDQQRWRVQARKSGTSSKGKNGTRSGPAKAVVESGPAAAKSATRRTTRQPPQTATSKLPTATRRKSVVRDFGPPLKPTPAMARAANQWLSRNPGGSPGDCAASLRNSFPRITGDVVAQILAMQKPQMVEDQKPKPRSEGRPTRSIALPNRDSSYKKAIVQWRRLHPIDSYDTCVSELKAQGFTGITRKLVSQTLLAQLPAKKRRVSSPNGGSTGSAAAKTSSKRRRGPTRAVEPQRRNQSLVQGCPACGIVPDRQSGSCRCS